MRRVTGRPGNTAEKTKPDKRGTAADKMVHDDAAACPVHRLPEKVRYRVFRKVVEEMVRNDPVYRAGQLIKSVGALIEDSDGLVVTAPLSREGRDAGIVVDADDVRFISFPRTLAAKPQSKIAAAAPEINDGEFFFTPCRRRVEDRCIAKPANTGERYIDPFEIVQGR